MWGKCILQCSACVCVLCVLHLPFDLKLNSLQSDHFEPFIIWKCEMPFLENPLIPAVLDTVKKFFSLLKSGFFLALITMCVQLRWGMNLCLRVRELATLSLIPVSGHPPGEFLSKTQEVREAIDCPWEDHSRLPAAADILLRLSGPRWKWIGPNKWVGIPG